jgi:DegV family protein with EDD domain
MVWFEEWLFREENKRAKEETKKFEELNRSQSRFFSNMSHEIRTPINSILGLNEIILRQEDASDEIISDATNIQGAGKMLLSLINDILDISKIEAGKMDIVPINYNLGDMISEIVNMIWLRANQKGLELKVEIDPTIPSELFGDEVRIKQILVNLLNNAVKYTSEGSVTLAIEKEETRGDDVLLLFSVIDTGMGIKQDVIPYLFDAFQRVDEEKNAKIEGTGLGLSIVKQLVDLMDGKISVTSVYTEGSTFVVALWQKVTRREAIGDVSIESYTKTGNRGKYEPGFKAPEARILIVDDNEMNLAVEKKLLDGTMIVVDTAKSGADALAMTSIERYDLILMDHLMPVMDGIECMQAIRKQISGLNNHVPIIVLTANADGESRELYNRSGFDSYLVKPVSGKDLEEMIITHLPESKVERTGGSEIEKVRLNTVRGYSKKIPVVIATSSMCDLPAQVLKEHQIDIIPFTIRSKDAIYYDLYEASSDEVMRYVGEGEEFDSSPPTTEEFEKFFSQEVKKAHQIIYFAISSGFSGEYENAKEAARAFGNVWVVNSALNCSAMGLMVLLAQRMVMQGRNFERIKSEIETLRPHIHCSFITGDADYVMKRAGINRVASNIVSTFGFRSVIHIKKGLITPVRLLVGEFDQCYKKYLDFALPRGANPDLEILMVDYVSLTDEEKEIIEKYIRNKYNFEHIIFQKVSSVMSLNCGRGAMGVAYLTKNNQPYSLAQMLVSVIDNEDEPLTAEEEESTPPVFEEPKVIPEKKKEWYEQIPGIDPVKAIENSGSEDSFKSVLKIFYQSVDDRSKEIEDYYNSEDWENYTIKVHALKSSARLVGAIDLSEDALSLEMAGKEGNIDFIRQHTDKLLRDFREYKEILSQYCMESEPIPDEEQKQEKKPEPRKEQNLERILIDSMYDTLKKAADKQDDRIIDMTLKEIVQYNLPDADRERLEKIKESLEAKDYTRIKELADAQ